ncbi:MULTISPECIES: helix-turn-helix domain-containing protein [unclassified Methylibium]|uniref:helix-turn-helix domain-containing protein n=1 Tax=unclassified Methylibium TaxID=2633235 RepID=UPI0003F41B8F|nr:MULTISPECIES: helix-turn-helix domain-containing protein [unclassified Methylibium]EWS53442.1 Helix-turn-helix domain protein [Methylibium sp. T29]EWS60030.1 Helix-turn-helix domain protein [Methylibium sp. T29-B]
MPATRLNPRLAKIHRSYTVEEIAKLYGVHRNTVRAWIGRGLPTIDQRRPLLVLGSHLADYLQIRRTANKRSCAPGEIYCLRCREPRAPAGGVVRYHPLTPTQGNLVGLCGCCGAGLNRRVSQAKLPLVQGVLSVMLPQAREHIDESALPSLNSDFVQYGTDHAKTPP